MLGFETCPYAYTTGTSVIHSGRVAVPRTSQHTTLTAPAPGMEHGVLPSLLGLQFYGVSLNRLPTLFLGVSREGDSQILRDTASLFHPFEFGVLNFFFFLMVSSCYALLQTKRSGNISHDVYFSGWQIQKICCHPATQLFKSLEAHLL